MANGDFFISLDIGTTSVKVALVGSTGDIVALSTREYGLFTPAENIVELDPQTYWNCCREGIAEVLQKSAVPPAQIKSIGACSQGETLITLDKKGQPLRNAIVWMDNRSDKEAAELKAAFGADNNTGQTDLVATWPITKILWLKKNQPGIYRQAAKYLLVEDYVLYRLTGLFCGDYSLYSSSYMVDIVKKEWWREILDYVGVSAEQLVDLGESGRIIGGLEPSACDQTGLVKGTKVVSGAMDQIAAMLGAGNTQSGIVTETTGAALAVCGTIDRFPPKTAKRTVAVQYHAIEDKYVLIGWCPTGGMAFKWLRDAFFTDENKAASCAGLDIYDYMTNQASGVAAGCQGLIFLPYLAGPGTGDVRPDAKGVFYGLELHHGRAHFARAVMESIGFVLRSNIAEMQRLGLDCTEIRSLGGGAKSRLWNQIKADVLGKCLVTMKCPEAASLGMAILQAVATGVYPSLRQAAENMVQTASVIEPNQNYTQTYEQVYRRFVELNRKCF
jgi:xylulokinase